MSKYTVKELWGERYGKAEEVIGYAGRGGRIRYTYKVYKDFPEATEISESRERNYVFLGDIYLLTLIASIICLIVDFSETWPMIFLAIASIASVYYLINYYPDVTEKKINKAIEKRLHMLEEIKNSKYVCKYIKILDSTKTGKCQICFAYDESLTLCKVKNDIGTRKIYLCDNCMNQYKDNSLEK